MRTEPPVTLAAYWEKFTANDIDVMYKHVQCNPVMFKKPSHFHKGMLPFISAKEMHDLVFKYNHLLSIEEMEATQHVCEVLKAHRPSILNQFYDPHHQRALNLRTRSTNISGLIAL